MARESMQLAELIGSRICHDLVSPLSAIGNGVELLELSGHTGEETELIAQSVANATARLQFFRIAFGSADATQSIGRTELARAAKGTLDGTRLSVAWQPREDIPRAEARLAFLLMLCCESAMPRGGEIDVSRERGHWHVRGTTERPRIDRELWDALSAGAATPQTSPAEVHFALAREVGQALGRPPDPRIEERGVSIAF